MQLFKYLRPDRLDVLRSARIRFSSLQALNDPFELKPHIEALATPEYLASKLENSWPELAEEQYEKLSPQQKGLLPRDKFLELMREQLPSAKEINAGLAVSNLPKLRRIISEGFEKTVGVLCLSESSTNLLMWSHYASSHQGFLIAFNPAHPFFDQRKSQQDEFRYLRRVIYSQKRPSVTLSNVNTFEPFLTKGNDWRYEYEWRMMLPLADCSEKLNSDCGEIHLFNLPKTSIDSVVMGARMEDSKKNEIATTLKSDSEYQHVKLMQAEIHDTEYRVVIRPAT